MPTSPKGRKSLSVYRLVPDFLEQVEYTFQARSKSMAEYLRLAALNAQNEFVTRYSAMEGVLDDRYDPTDVQVISEAAPDSEEGGDVLCDARTYLDRHGYEVVDVPYDDEDNRPDTHRLLMAVRRGRLERFERLRLAGGTGVGRTALRASLTGGIDVIGVHLDDRTEKTRRLQAASVLGAAAVGRTTILAGDMNAMHRWNAMAVVSRAAGVLRPLSDRLPVGVPGTEQSPMARMNSLYRRVNDMADGGTMELMKRDGYRDADICRFPTKGMLQLDHIMVPENVYVADLERLDVNGLSDHLAIRADLEVYPKAS